MTKRLPPGRDATPESPTGSAASVGAPIYHLINRSTPLPAPERRRLIWLRNGDAVRFAGGISLTVAIERTVHAVPTVWLYYRRSTGQGISVTAYQPVSMESEADCHVVPRAIAVAANGTPLGVAISIEGIHGAPENALEARYA